MISVSAAVGAAAAGGNQPLHILAATTPSRSAIRIKEIEDLEKPPSSSSIFYVDNEG